MISHAHATTQQPRRGFDLASTLLPCCLDAAATSSVSVQKLCLGDLFESRDLQSYLVFSSISSKTPPQTIVETRQAIPKLTSFETPTSYAIVNGEMEKAETQFASPRSKPANKTYDMVRLTG